MLPENTLKNIKKAKNEQEIVDAFKKSNEYFESIRNWHRKHGGIAVEREVLNLIFRNIKVGNKILDAGCGEGSITNWMAEKFPKIEFYGVDISDIGINYAKQEAISRNLKNVIFMIGDLKSLDFQKNFFDLIYSQSVIEHIVNYEVAIDEFRRVLKPGGKLIIRVANGGVEGKKSYKAIFDYIFHKNELKRLNPTLVFDGECTHNFDVNSIPSDILLKQLKKCGFKIVYFSTLRRHIRQNLQEVRLIKKIWRFVISIIPIFPFTHLGPTIVVEVEKEK